MTTFLEHPLAQRALLWAAKAPPTDVPDEYFCPTRDVLRARLDSLLIRLRKNGIQTDALALTDAVLSEIGNNAFDHNIGNWPDTPGVFFASETPDHSLFVIADRGQGIRTTLSRVRTGLATDLEALKVAFTERISGRAPERRGNGLKFVRHVLLHDGLDMWFGSGAAAYEVTGNHETWSETDRAIAGCCAILRTSL